MVCDGLLESVYERVMNYDHRLLCSFAYLFLKVSPSVRSFSQCRRSNIVFCANGSKGPYLDVRKLTNILTCHNFDKIGLKIVDEGDSEREREKKSSSCDGLPAAMAYVNGCVCGQSDKIGLKIRVKCFKVHLMKLDLQRDMSCEHTSTLDTQQRGEISFAHFSIRIRRPKMNITITIRHSIAFSHDRMWAGYWFSINSEATRSILQCKIDPPSNGMCFRNSTRNRTYSNWFV